MAWPSSGSTCSRRIFDDVLVILQVTHLDHNQCIFSNNCSLTAFVTVVESRKLSLSFVPPSTNIYPWNKAALESERSAPEPLLQSDRLPQPREGTFSGISLHRRPLNLCWESYTFDAGRSSPPVIHSGAQHKL
jgi:hypothetical protein